MVIDKLQLIRATVVIFLDEILVRIVALLDTAV
jgi:hypothetical protein